MSAPLAWPALLRLGLHQLGLAPGLFWQLTPAELLMMLGRGAGGQAPLDRSGLEALMARYPDEKKGQSDG